MSSIAPHWFDHAFVVIALVIVFPFVGLWSYRRFLRHANQPGALVREYQLTVGWLVGLLIATCAVWALAGRDFADLFRTNSILGEDENIASVIALAATAGLFLRPVLALFSSTARAVLAKQFASLEAFLPKTAAQLSWGLVVSVAAGVCEEIAYRGFLAPYFAAYLPMWGVIAAIAVLFGMAHLYQGAAGVVMTGVLGAAFTLLYFATGSLLLPIVLHALVDISAMLTAYIVLRQRKAP